MFRAASFLCLMVIVMLGCHDRDDKDDRKDTPGTTRLTAKGERNRVRPPLLPAPPALPAPVSPTPPADPGETTRLTSEGERMRVQIPPLDPVLEVPAGSPCGVLNARGEMLSCQAGTVCVGSPDALGSPATCQPTQRARRWDG
jgi:hypothetical protein